MSHVYGIMVPIFFHQADVKIFALVQWQRIFVAFVGAS